MSLVKSYSSDRDGLNLWRALHQEYLTNTRGRSLALAQALSSFPACAKDKTAMGNALAFERVVEEFETKMATLVRRCDAKLLGTSQIFHHRQDHIQ